jgi:hypothetical protein
LLISGSIGDGCNVSISSCSCLSSGFCAFLRYNRAQAVVWAKRRFSPHAQIRFFEVDVAAMTAAGVMNVFC